MKFVWKCLAAALSWFWLVRVNAAPTIVITNLPAYGSFNNLGGLVLNANPAACAVAVFIYVPGYGWVTKPNCSQPLTAILPDGSWTADIRTGGSDPQATRVAALLVSTNYSQPCVNGSHALPINVYEQATASAVVTCEYPGVRWLSFSGYLWRLKSSTGPVGPGPNYFSDSTNNVWLDAQGKLHLRLTNRSNHWQCAELVSARTFGYGSYRVELDSRVDNLDPNVVLGLFTWSDDLAYDYREIDIECSRWGNASDPNNAQYVVQPSDAAGHLARFAVPTGLTNSTLLFTWETNRVAYQSQRGRYSTTPAPANVISNWTYTLTPPKTGDENMRFNLWLNSGNAPKDKKEVEVIIKSFEFVPLGAPQPAVLTNFSRPSPAKVSFALSNSQPDRRYEVRASTNVLDWQTLCTLLATNTTIGFSDTNSAAFDQRFYRAVTLP
jgi:hypothetical protein